MTQEEAKGAKYDQFMEASEESLLSARSELVNDRMRVAVSQTYYACFYAVSAVLTLKQRQFTKHSAVRESLHLHLVKTNLLTKAEGRLYDELFSARMQGNYGEMIKYSSEQSKLWIEEAEKLITKLKTIKLSP